MDDTGQQQGEHEWPRRITYSWDGVAHSSASIKSINGEEVARNHVPSPSLAERVDFDSSRNAEVASVEGPGGLYGRVTVPDNDTAYVGLERPRIAPGEWAGIALNIGWGDGIGRVRMQAQFRDDNNVSLTAPQQLVEYSDHAEGGRVVAAFQAPEGATHVRPYFWFYLENQSTAPPAGSTIHLDYFSVSTARTKAEALVQVQEYFDGDTEDVTLWPSGTTAISSFTRDWWGRLPRYVQDADRAQGPEPYPLLRFLDGVGFHAGRVREATWDMWSGVAIDPPTAPDSLMPWISYLLGLGDHHRAHGPRHLRETVLAHVSGGTNQAGTRDHIAAMVRPFLEPGAQLSVRPSTASRNTLVIGVDPDDVPGQDYEKLMRQIRVAGIVPAGHALLAQDLRATWDEWESTAGATWAEKERNIGTWEESDRAGIELL